MWIEKAGISTAITMPPVHGTIHAEGIGIASPGLVLQIDVGTGRAVRRRPRWNSRDKQCSRSGLRRLFRPSPGAIEPVCGHNNPMPSRKQNIAIRKTGRGGRGRRFQVPCSRYQPTASKIGRRATRDTERRYRHGVNPARRQCEIAPPPVVNGAIQVR